MKIWPLTKAVTVLHATMEPLSHHPSQGDADTWDALYYACEMLHAIEEVRRTRPFSLRWIRTLWRLLGKKP